MTTDTTSVDALRTRLARAFEVAALRDPSAELAEFEASVRHEHGERCVEALTFQHLPRCECEIKGAPFDNARDPKCKEWDGLVRHSLRNLAPPP